MPVLVPEHLEVGDPDGAPAAARHETAVLLRALRVERHGPSLGTLPPRAARPTLEVRLVQYARTTRRRRPRRPGRVPRRQRPRRRPAVRCGRRHCARRGRSPLSPAHAAKRCFCQNIPSPAMRNPIMSLTAIIGALTAALPVDDRADRGCLPGQRLEVGQLDGQTETVTPVLGVDDGQHLKGLLRRVARRARARCRPRAGPMRCAPPLRPGSGPPERHEGASFSRTRSTSQTSSSWSPSPWGSSVDMHRNSAHWSAS